MTTSTSEPMAGTQQQPVDQGATIASIKTAYQKAREKYSAASASAESAEEKQNLKRPSIGDYSTDMLAAIEHDVKSPEAFDGLLWLYEKTKRQDGPTAEKYLAPLMEHHFARENMGSVASWIAYADNSKMTEQHLLKILENNKHEVDLAKTVLGLIKHYQALKAIQTDADTRGYAEKSIGEEGLKYADSRSREALNLLIDKYFALGMQKYSEVQIKRRPFSETLAPFHFEHSRLQIGMQAPDIIGEDIAGVKFKLSDYRGKVVMIDFWGDW